MSETERSGETGAVARAYFEAVAVRDLEAMVEFYEPGGTGEIHGLVELTAPLSYRAWFANLFAAFPDFRFEMKGANRALNALADASIVIRPGGRGSWALADPLFAAYVRREIHADWK